MSFSLGAVALCSVTKILATGRAGKLRSVSEPTLTFQPGTSRCFLGRAKQEEALPTAVPRALGRGVLEALPREVRMVQAGVLEKGRAHSQESPTTGHILKGIDPFPSDTCQRTSNGGLLSRPSVGPSPVRPLHCPHGTALWAVTVLKYVTLPSDTRHSLGLVPRRGL